MYVNEPARRNSAPRTVRPEERRYPGAVTPKTEPTKGAQTNGDDRPRRSNAERRASTRSAVLNATIQAIVQYGYVGATSTRIAELSGFTRGAQKHHFPNKAAMVAEALVHLHENLMRESLRELESASRDGVPSLLQALWKSFQADLFTAAVELRVAARIDEELKSLLIPAEQEIGRRIRKFVSTALDDGRHSQQRLDEIGDHVVNVLRGMAFQGALYPNQEREARQLRILEETVHALLNAPDQHRRSR